MTLKLSEKDRDKLAWLLDKIGDSAEDGLVERMWCYIEDAEKLLRGLQTISPLEQLAETAE